MHTVLRAPLFVTQQEETLKDNQHLLGLLYPTHAENNYDS